MAICVRIDGSSPGNQPGKKEEAWYEKEDVEVLWWSRSDVM